MVGAIIGDIAGSRFEFDNHLSKDFDLFAEDCRPTDDSVLTVAVGRAIWESDGKWEELEGNASLFLRQFGKRYPDAGYGERFRKWMYNDRAPAYHSFGNGAAMRVSAAGFAARSQEEARLLAHKVTCVTHDHPEGLKGAESVAVAIFLARQRWEKDRIRAFIEDNYYKIGFTPEDLRGRYSFDESCQNTVPQAFCAFFAGRDFEDVVRTAVSIGGDSDTIAAIAGSVAEAYYGVPEPLRRAVYAKLNTPQYMLLYRWLLAFEVYFQGWRGADARERAQIAAFVRGHIREYGAKNIDRLLVP